jgi:hypothetical protein
MNRIRITPALRSLALAGAAALAFTGCLTANESASATESDSDGQAAYMTSEVDQMGQVYGQIGDAAAKTSALGAGITITGELVIDPFKYHDSCQCFVRHAVYTGMKGYERDRLDSVKLYDSTGAIMTKWRPAQIAKIVHSRNVKKSGSGREADIRFDIVVEIKNDGGTKKGTWNGTMTGSYAGSEFKSGTMTNVVRTWDNGHFGFPESGTIEIDRPVFHFLAEFLGDGKAKVTIKNKLTGKIRILYVDANYNETANP